MEITKRMRQSLNQTLNATMQQFLVQLRYIVYISTFVLLYNATIVTKADRVNDSRAEVKI